MDVRNLDNFEKTIVKFSYNGDTIQMELTSHLTCITNDSGSGKTRFLQRLLDNSTVNDIVIESEYPVEVVDLTTVHLVLDRNDRRIVIIDEANVLNSKANIINQINKSKHLFICISRSVVGSLSYPLQGIYDLRIKDDWFSVRRVHIFNVDSAICNNIIVEASEDRSEYCILNKYFENIIAAHGKNNIVKYIAPNAECTVFMDLGNVGTAYDELGKHISNHVHFYDYQAFEQLLSEYLEITDLRNFDFQSNERCLEHVVIENTKNTPLKYKHGSRLSDEWDKIGISLLNTNVGRSLYNYLLDSGQDNEEQSNKEQLEKEHATRLNVFGG